MMLRVLRATVARRSSRTYGASFLTRRKVKSGAISPIPPLHTPSHFRVLLLRNLSSRQGKTQTEANETQHLLDSQSLHSFKHEDLSDDSESLKSAEEDNILAPPEMEEDEEEDDDDDDDEGDLLAEYGEDVPSNSTAEFEEENCAIDLSNVPEELKEMLEDDYVLESAEEELSSDGPIELLTLDEVKQVLEEVRARDVQIFSVQDRCEWADVMVVATGISDRHVRGITDALVFKIKKKRNVESSLYPTIEGQVGGRWLVVDCGNIVIHILNEDSRAYYRLEDLWTGDAKPSTTDEDLDKMLSQAGLKEVVP